ncbi:unnamed protein product, partial [Ranitomeya imitator]
MNGAAVYLSDASIDSGSAGKGEWQLSNHTHLLLARSLVLRALIASSCIEQYHVTTQRWKSCHRPENQERAGTAPGAGCTWEFGAMVNYIRKTFPQTRLIVVGFSLGGNIVCKYLGEAVANQERVLCAVSVCQGYSASRAQETFLQWDQCRRFYNFLMADNMKKIILSHRHALFTDSRMNKVFEDSVLSRLYTATSLMQIDDTVMRRFHGYKSLKEYYEEESCVRYLHNIQVPLMLVNSTDDPLVHESLLSIPKTLATNKETVMVVLPLHGGHLGFFEGAVLFPEPLTWMDKLLVQYSNAICQWEKNKSKCSDKEPAQSQP